VTPSGAFVDVLLGGGSLVQAGTTQVPVLVTLLAVEAIAVVIMSSWWLVGHCDAPRLLSNLLSGIWQVDVP
jgi:hypothetical protein